MPSDNKVKYDIKYAPMNGLVIVVGHRDVGEYAMAWEDSVTNHLVADEPEGMWVAYDKSFTWCVSGGMGSSYWREFK